MNPLICVIPYHNGDYDQAVRLINWIKELDGHIDNHYCMMVADDAVPMEKKRSLDSLVKTVFTGAETAVVKAPAPVNGNYHVPAAVMFERAAHRVDTVFKWNWLWCEPDAVPLKPGWLDELAYAYENCPKRFMGSITKTDGKDVPPIVMFGTAVYPNCAHPDIKKFCDGATHFDMAMSNYTVQRAENTPLIHHRWGSPTEVPTFKAAKLPNDGPNVGTLDNIPKEAVLFHRCKNDSLIELLRSELHRNDTLVGPMISVGDLATVIKTVQEKGVAAGIEMNVKLAETPQSPIKRGPGRPPKQPVEQQA